MQAQALVEQARKLRVRRSVDFVGHLPDRALIALLAAADVVVLPSRYEPFGIVALEAAAAGAPLVASTAGGLAELVVDGVTGLSVAPGDVDGIVDAVRAVLADPAAAAAAGRGGPGPAGRRSSTGRHRGGDRGGLPHGARCRDRSVAGPPEDRHRQRLPD